MPKFKPYLTDDGSVGLFSGDFNDVFHSRTGALTEAYEKFVFPSSPDKLKHKQINLLDICYGIGYNSKAFLNYVIKKNFFRTSLISQNIVSIGADNLHHKCGSVRTDNKQNYTENKPHVINNIPECFPSINIDAIEFEKEFVYISGFIKEHCYNNDLKILPIVNDLIIDNLIRQFGAEFYSELKKIKETNFDSHYFDNNLINLTLKSSHRGYNYTQTSVLSALLHNIYYRYLSKQPSNAHGEFYSMDYRYLSKRYLREIYPRLAEKININYYIDDARRVVKNLDKLYNCIYLDAFTPAKAPALWSVEFFKELYRLLTADGILLTYSNSARIRNAMRLAGFYIGTIKDSKGFPAGTAAVKLKENITFPLNFEDNAKLLTRSGIPYHDYNLNFSNEEILKDLQEQINKSSLPTLSQYMKGVQNEI